MFEVEEPLLEQSSHVLACADQNKPTVKSFKARQSQLTCYPSLINFGDCMPGQISEVDVHINIQPWKQQILVLHVACDCIDEELNDLPEYIFALTKDNYDAYSHEIRIKANGESTAKFTVAMKVPEFQGFVAGLIVIRLLASNVEPLKLFIKSNVVMPRIICTKELSCEEMRTTRIMIKSSRLGRKQDRKIAFKNLSDLQLAAQTQVLSLEENDFVECSPRSLTILPSALFNLIIQIRPSQGLIEYIRGLRENYTLRRVLIIKSKSSSVIFHFPLEIIFVYSEMRETVE